MSLDFAILGFLNYRPSTGYDLKKVFDTSVRHFWAADQSQIYRTLARLSDEGLTRIELVPQDDRPDRKVYHITDQGREALKAWVAGPFPSVAPHSGPLVQVFFSGMLTDEQALARFEEAAAIFRATLALYDQVPGQVEEYRARLGDTREHYFWMLTLDLGRRTMQAQLDWAESVITQLKANMKEEKP